MIKNIADRDRIFAEFDTNPKLQITDKLREEIRLNHRQYLFFNFNGEKDNCHCTACGKTFDKPENAYYRHTGAKTLMGDVRLFEAKCPSCGAICYTKNHNIQCRILDHGKAIVYFAVRKNLYIRCCDTVTATSSYPEDPPQKLKIHADHNRYFFRPGEAQRWQCAYKWNSLKSCGNPSSYPLSANVFGVNAAAVKRTFLKHFVPVKDMFIDELAWWTTHPNTEYLLKGGFKDVLVEYFNAGHYPAGGDFKPKINWRSNNLKKMLYLTTPEVKLLATFDRKENFYSDYISARKTLSELPERFPPERILELAEKYKYNLNIPINLSKRLGLTFAKIDHRIDRAITQHVNKSPVEVAKEWEDYLLMARRLGYNLADSAIYYPADIVAAHDKLVAEINAQKDELRKKELAEKQRAYKKIIKARQKLEFTDPETGLTAILPRKLQEIEAEGKAQSNCVSGYTSRHADGRLTIIFVRLESDPAKSLYTVEINTDFKIVQFLGYKNKKPNKTGKAFMKTYQAYLDNLKKSEKQAEIKAKIKTKAKNKERIEVRT